MTDISTRNAVIGLLNTQDDKDPRDTPFFKELTKGFLRWQTNYLRAANRTNMEPKKQWTRDTYNEFKDMDPETLLNDPYFLGLEDQIYPVHVHEIVTVFNLWRAGKVNEAIDMSAIGIGKTLKSSVLAWLFTYDTLVEKQPAVRYGLAPNSKIALVIMSRNAKLAKDVTFTQMLPFFDCPFFNDYFPPQVNIAQIEAARKYPNVLYFPKRFAIFPGSGNYLSVLGYNLVFAVLDEFAWMEKITKSKRSSLGFSATEYDAARETYNTISNRILSRVHAGDRKGFIMMVSSPRTKYDFAEIKYKHGVKNRRRIESGEEIPVTPILTRPPTDEERVKGITGDMYIMPDNTIDIERPIYAMSRKAMWRGMPQFWKGKQNWSGEYLLFDPQKMMFVSEEVHLGLFDDEEDFDKHGHFKVAIEVVDKFLENPQRAYRDLGGQATSGIFVYFSDLSKIQARKDVTNYAIDRGEGIIQISNKYQIHEPSLNSKHARYGHADLAKNHDLAAGAVCYVSGWQDKLGGLEKLPIVTFDWIHEFMPKRGQSDIRVKDVMDMFVEVDKRGFDMALVTYDGFQSLGSIQMLWDEYEIPTGHLSIDHCTGRVLIKGIADTGNYGCIKEGISNHPIAAWEEFKTALFEGRVLFPVYEKAYGSLLQQFEQEEYYADAKAGKGQVDHPPGGKHDLLQCLVGAYFNCFNNEYWSGANLSDHTPDIKAQSRDEDYKLSKQVQVAGLSEKDAKDMGL